MNSRKLALIDEYLAVCSSRSRSDVIKTALNVLQQNDLVRFYLEASTKVDSDFEATSADGLDDAT